MSEEVIQEITAGIRRFTCDGCGRTTRPAERYSPPEGWCEVTFIYDLDPNEEKHLCDKCALLVRKITRSDDAEKKAE